MKIYDCFPFFNELELLELRLAMLDDVVDRFVLVEATQSHTGAEKPLFFAENRMRFHRYLDKIEHVIVRDLPNTKEPWERDRYQRNAILRGLAHVCKEDLVLLSDVDEIPRPESIHLLTGEGRCLRLLETDPIVLTQGLYYYYVNCLDPLEPWHGTIAIRAENFAMVPDELRTLRFRLPRLSDGGWHFTYLGGIEKIIEKLHAKAEQDINNPENNDPEVLRRNLETGRSLIDSPVRHQFLFLEPATFLPTKIMEWLQRYPEHAKKQPPQEWSLKPQETARFLSDVGKWEWFKWRQKINRTMSWD